MGRPDDDIRDHLHREDFEKEEEEELDELEEQYDDLIGAGVDNNQMAATAEATRAMRAAQDQEQEQNQVDDMFDMMEEHEFIGAPPPMAEDVQKGRSTADEDEEGSPLAAPGEPGDEDDEPLPGALPGENWAADGQEALAAPAASEAFVSSSDWLKSE
jgi:hypothetical protein